MPRGKEPWPPQTGPKDGAQVNLTAEASRIMPRFGGGLEQSDNAQAGVDVDAMMVIPCLASSSTCTMLLSAGDWAGSPRR